MAVGRVRALMILVLFAWLAAAGCTSLSDQTLYGDVDGKDVMQRLVDESPHGTAPDVDVLALSPEAEQLVAELRRLPSLRARLGAMSDLFTEGQGLGLEYQSLGTYTAAETLERRAGNCLAFTNLFIAVARNVGLDARFREMYGLNRWDEVGDFVLVNRHVGAYGEIPFFGSYLADFGQLNIRDDRLGGIISDERARALHFNNLGARALTRGEHVDAVRQFNRALQIDPRLSYVWGNLGTAYARLDDPERAEMAYRQALRVDSFDSTAVKQLGRLYESLGEERLAEHYFERAQRLRHQNPYRQFYDGLDAMAEGDLARAVQLLQRAVRAQPSEMHFHLQLAKAYALQGDQRRARDRFARAANLVELLEDEVAIRDTIAELEMLAVEPRQSRRTRFDVDVYDYGTTLPSRTGAH
jgi:tetratricopeptide (TPR) repeat protein